MATTPRRAHPFRDTDVLDERAPRFNQAVVGLVAFAGVVFGWPLAWAAMAAQLGVGLVFGRQYCLPCLAYFLLVQPRIGEGRLEDARPPRLANTMGFALLSAAAALWWLGSPAAGALVATLVGGLALLAAGTGFCAGCEVYRLTARVRGISSRRHGRVDPADLGGMGEAGEAMVEFTHPLCSECAEWDARLAHGDRPVVRIDVRERPDLARKYGVAIVPTVVRVGTDGAVLQRLAP